jgi:filamentous hemagglutinin family protein
MNNACKVIWSHTLQQMVVVSEIVRGRGKAKSVTQGSEPHTTSTAINTGMWAAKTLAGALALAFGALTAFAPALSQSVANNALPTGGNVAAGSAAIHQSGASMLIDQASQRAVLNWQSFNVGKDAQVHFNNAGGSTLNRVTGPEASTIMGRITAPGQVIISNGNGVFFGRGSMVDVGSLIATTHSIGNEQFMAGDLSFERKGSTASVVNEGELRAKLEGYIALMAPEVRNQGLIVATKGTVALAAGEVVELQLDPNNKLTNIRVSAGQWQALVENKQAIEAEGGLVILSAMAARELQGSVVSNSGSINASSLTSVGGRIILTGDAITLKDGSKITATGATGGGQVLVGGD